jgi:aerobic carbon-monoxide dehydrogenase large subunit
MSDDQATPTTRYLGKRVPRVEDPRLLRGEARFIADVALPGMLHARFVRSTHAHARIRALDTTRARGMTGVAAVFTGADLAAAMARPFVLPCQPPVTSTVVPVVAVDKVRFAGDPVAVVVAVDRYVAEDAAEAVEIDYEDLPLVLDAEQAAAPSAPRVDDSLDSNVIARFLFENGDVAGAFADADRVIRVTYRQHRQAHAPLETRGCLAAWDKGATRLELHTSTQQAHPVREAIAPLVGLPPSRVRVITPDVGGGFGQKGTIHREEIAISLVSRLVGRPVKWIEDRRENLTASAQAREDTCHLEVAVKNDGTLLAMRAELFNNAGAYPTGLFPGHLITLFTASGITGPWKFAAFAFDARCVLTNKCPIVPYRAPLLAGHVIAENVMEVIAQELGLDPVELRRKHVVRLDDQPYHGPNGFPLMGVTSEITLERALARLGYADFRQRQAAARREGRYLGLGLCTFFQVGALPTAMWKMVGMDTPTWNTTLLRVDANGEIAVHTGISPHGQGHETTMAQLVAEELGVPLELVSLHYGDTARDPFGPGTVASLSQVTGGGSVQRAARLVRDKALRIAGHMLEVAAGDLELRGGGRIGIRGVPAAEVTWTDVAHLANVAVMALPEGEEPGLQATATYEPPHPGLYGGTHACIAEVDVETGQVHIERYVVVSDSGTVINPAIVEGQILGGVVQGLGGVLCEHAAYGEDGTFLADSLQRYTLPRAADVPPLEIEHLNVPDPSLPYGAKPVGEAGVSGAAPALINAIADALAPFGVRPTEQPLTPSRLLELIRASATSRRDRQ